MPQANPSCPSWALRARAELERRSRGQTGPASRFCAFREDPVGFAEQVLGIAPWSRQQELLQAAAAYPRVICRSGHKVSKSNSAAIIALWWALTRPGGRAIITAPTARQIRDVIWRELRLLRRGAPVMLGGDLAYDPGTGWRFPGEAQILGFATNEPERLGGYSGPHVLFIVDEGSGVDDETMEVIDGNMAGGARLLALGNPTRATGWFARACKAERHLWKLLSISSEESPNVTGERNIPGLATAAWIEEMAEKWGRESNWYRIRVLGEFPEADEDTLFPLSWIEAAQDRWRVLDRAGDLPTPDTLALDVAAGVRRDRGVIAACCWPVVVDLWASNEADTMEQSGRMFRGWQQGRQLIVDADGMGAPVVQRLRELGAQVTAYHGGASCDLTDDSSELRFSDHRSWAYWRLREMLDPATGCGLALPPDERLVEELYAHAYTQLSNGKLKVVPKDRVVAKIGRSPDLADAVVMGLTAPRDPLAWVAVAGEMFRTRAT